IHLNLRNLISRWYLSLDAFRTYPVHTYLPSDAVGTTTGTPEVCPSRSSRTKDSSSQISYAHDGYGLNCPTTFLTQLAYRFHGRTAHRLGPTTAPGYDEPTPRSHSSPSTLTL